MRHTPPARHPDLATSRGRALLGVARAWLHQDPGELPSPGDLMPLWPALCLHGLGGMLGWGALAGWNMPERLASIAREHYCTNILRTHQALALSRRIMAAAAQRHIHLTPVKGPALAPAYGDDGIRGFGDLDMLVGSREAACQLARDTGLSLGHGAEEPLRGWSNRSRGIGRVQASSVNLQVEFTLGCEPANQPVHDLCVLWPDRFLPPPVQGTEPSGLAVETHLLFLLQHLAMHWCSRIIWLVDAAVLMRIRPANLSWLEESAGRLELMTLLRSVSRFCRDELGVEVPQLCARRGTWKDGLFLSLVSPATLWQGSFLKYGGGRRGKLRDTCLGICQHVMSTDLQRASLRSGNAASRWTTSWMQYVISPGGRLVGHLGPVITGGLFLLMVAWVCFHFKRSPRAFRRLAEQPGIAGPAAPADAQRVPDTPPCT
jgi:hypothetical protein